jgi:4-hydroxy-4-methyl-2-oxoglutarate aldolase
MIGMPAGAPVMPSPLAPYSTATLHEAAGRIGALPNAIRPLDPGMRVAGPALTVACLPGDNLWIHRALEHAQAGQVLVVHVGGLHEAGYWGEVLAQAALVRGLAGLVIDGCVRDCDALIRLGLPTFARGLSVVGTSKVANGAGAIGAAIRIGEVLIQPGDAIVGDRDGVVSIPAARVDEVGRLALERDQKEAAILSEIGRGRSTFDIYGF